MFGRLCDGETQDQTAAGRRLVERPQRARQVPRACDRFADGNVVAFVRKRQQRVHPAGRLRDADSEPRLQGGDEAVAPLGIDLVHARHMARIVPVENKLGQNRLLERQRLTVGDRLRRDERVDETGRRHQIADAHRGERGDAERADRAYAPARVQRGERGRPGALVAEDAVVFVLDDPGVGGLSPGEQRLTPSGRHRHPGRPLVRARHVRHARVRGKDLAGQNVQSLFIDGNGHDLGARPEQRAADARRRGILEPDAVAGVEHQAADEVERLLRAADDDDPIFSARDAAAGAQLRGDRLAQRAVPCRIAVADRVHARPAHDAAGESRPRFERKVVEGGDPRLERDRLLADESARNVDPGEEPAAL